MRGFLLRFFTFLLVSAGCTVGSAMLVVLLIPGRSLPGVRQTLQVDLEREGEGTWMVKEWGRIEEGQAWQPPASGVRAMIQESSNGRWDRGLLIARRHRRWFVADVCDPNGSLFITGGRQLRLNLSPEAANALIRHVEDRVIPDSTLWELWPAGESRSEISREWWPHDPVPALMSWSHFADKRYPWPLVVGPLLGVIAAMRVRTRRSGPRCAA